MNSQITLGLSPELSDNREVYYAAVCARQAAPAQRAVLLSVIRRFTPDFEVNSEDTVVFRADGLRRMVGPLEDLAARIGQAAEAEGVLVNVAVAATPDAAIVAARNLNGYLMVPAGGELRMLGHLPLSVLALSPQAEQTLLLWGVRTLNQAARLPEADLVERLGEEGARLSRLASGTASRILQPVCEPRRFFASAELEHSIELLEPLLFILGRLLSEVVQGLQFHGFAASELKIDLSFAGPFERQQRSIRLPVPLLDHRTLLKVVQLDLEAHLPTAPVRAVRLEALPTQPRAVQGHLYAPPVPEPARLELTLARLRKLAGPESVGFAELLNSYRPGAFRLLPHAPAQVPDAGREVRAGKLILARRVFRPALPATVAAKDGRPRSLRAQGITGAIRRAAGPWRSSGEWWSPDTWLREEWDVELDDGRVYCISVDRAAGKWFVEAVYD